MIDGLKPHSPEQRPNIVGRVQKDASTNEPTTPRMRRIVPAPGGSLLSTVRFPESE